MPTATALTSWAYWWMKGEYTQGDNNEARCRRASGADKPKSLKKERNKNNEDVEEVLLVNQFQFNGYEK